MLRDHARESPNSLRRLGEEPTLSPAPASGNSCADICAEPVCNGVGDRSRGEAAPAVEAITNSSTCSLSWS